MAIVKKQLKSGTRWQARVHLGGNRFTSKTFERKADAEKWEREQATRRDGGHTVAGTAARSQTVADYAWQWYRDREPNYAPTTAEKVRAQIGARVASGVLADLPIGKLTAGHMRDWYRSMDGLAPSTQAGVDKTFRQIARRAHREGLVARDPYDVLERGERPTGSGRRDMRLLTPDEIRHIETVIGAMDPDGPSRLMVRLAAQTGMRSEEVIGLRAQYLDTAARELVVREVAPLVSGKPVPADVPKTDAAYRTIALPGPLADELADYNTAVGRGFVFRWHDGGLVRRNSWWRGYWKPAVHDLDQPLPRYHDLRHSHASQLLRDGIPVTAVSRRLGHANPAVTLKLYAHSMPGMDRETADRIAAIYG